MNSFERLPGEGEGEDAGAVVSESLEFERGALNAPYGQKDDLECEHDGGDALVQVKTRARSYMDYLIALTILTGQKRSDLEFQRTKA